MNQDIQPIDIVLDDDITIEFDVTGEHYNDYVDHISPNDKLTAPKKFLMSCVTDKSREQLEQKLAEHPTYLSKLFESVTDEYVQKLDIKIEHSERETDTKVQAVDLVVNGQPLQFDMTAKIYNKHVNAINPGDRVSAIWNMLITAVTKDGKTYLKQLMTDHATHINQIYEKLMDAYTPDIQAIVKKSKRKPK